MEYYELLNLAREPFSNSPDPDMFYRSRSQLECLYQLEIAVRLRRGLNVVLGGVGSGKTTVCRQLVRTLVRDGAIDTSLILDPGFADQAEFLGHLCRTLGMAPAPPGASVLDLKERLKFHLFEQAVERGRVICLVIDEGQKIRPECMESLRELLNYETNEFKLIQIVVFAQNEFMDLLRAQANLADRVNYLHALKPLSLGETASLVETRMNLAAMPDLPRPRFTRPALAALYVKTGGFPRRIVRIAHKCLLTLIGGKKMTVGLSTVLSCAASESCMHSSPSKKRRFAALAAGVLVLAGLAYAIGVSGWLAKQRAPAETAKLETSAPEAKPAAPPAAPASVPDAPAEPAAPAVAAETASPTLEPVSLGKAKIPAGATVRKLLDDLYGRKDKAALEALAKANPGVPLTLDARPAGALAFAPLTAEAPPQGVAILAAAKVAGLEQGFALIADKSKSGAPLRLFAAFVPGEGLSVWATLAKVYGSPEAAAKDRSKLPPDLAEAAKVLAWFPPDTVFYTTLAGDKGFERARAEAAKIEAARVASAKLAQERADAARAEAAKAKAAQDKAEADKAKAAQDEVARAEADKAAKEEAAKAQDLAAKKPDAEQGNWADDLLGPEPELIDRAAIKSGWSIARRLEDLYGDKSERVASALAKANPQIARMDKLRVGEPVDFPVLRAKAPPAGSAFVSVTRPLSLAKAFDYVIAHTTPERRLTLFVTQAPGKAASLDVVQAVLYPSVSSAWEALAALPAALKDQAVVLSNFPADTVFSTTVAAFGKPGQTPKPAKAEAKAQPETAEAAPAAMVEKTKAQPEAAETAPVSKVEKTKAQPEAAEAAPVSNVEKTKAEAAPAPETAKNLDFSPPKAETGQAKPAKAAASAPAPAPALAGDQPAGRDARFDPPPLPDQPKADAPKGKPGKAKAGEPASSAGDGAIIGKAKVRTGFALARRLEYLYGRAGKDIDEAVAKANPGLGAAIDPDKGATVAYPAVAAPAPAAGSALLAVTGPETLEAAFDFVVARSTPQAPLMAFATKDPSGATTVRVVAAKLFASPDEAETARRELPRELAGSAEVVATFAPGTVFYSAVPAKAVVQTAGAKGKAGAGGQTVRLVPVDRTAQASPSQTAMAAPETGAKP